MHKSWIMSRISFLLECLLFLFRPVKLFSFFLVLFLRGFFFLVVGVKIPASAWPYVETEEGGSYTETVRSDLSGLAMVQLYV